MDLVLQAPDLSTPLIKSFADLTAASRIAAISSPLHQAFRITTQRHDDATRAAVAALAAENPVDVAWVPAEWRRDRVGLVVMDMDSTLITIECIDEIADMLGIKPQVSAVTAAAMRGEIDFPESLRRRVALLAGLDEQALHRVYHERLQLSPGAERMLAGFKLAGARTLLVSGGFTVFTDRLKARLGLDYAASNVLAIADGRLTGGIVGDIVDAAQKAAWIHRLRQELGLADKLIVAIGDGANDLPMLAAADVGVAYRAKPVVQAQASLAVNHCGLDAVLNLFGTDD